MVTWLMLPKLIETSETQLELKVFYFSTELLVFYSLLVNEVNHIVSFL